jgi:enterochelin esterase family protein
MIHMALRLRVCLAVCGVFATVFPAPGHAQTAPNTLCLPTGTVAAWRSNAPPIVSPEISSDMKVTLRLCAPDARSVRVFGDWNQNSADGNALSRDDQGVWSISVGPVKPEFYQYYFTVDGVKTIDPANVHSGNDAVRITSYFIVPGGVSDTALYESRNVPHGDVIAVWYPSKMISSPRRALIYTPPDYRVSNRRYPVLYLFHGWGGDENEWLDLGRIAQIMDNMISAGRVTPMIVVMPNGHPDRQSIPDITPPSSIAVLGPLPPKGYDSSDNVSQIEKSIIGELVPYVDQNFRTREEALSRAIAGLSMGGAQASYTGLRHPNEFAWVASFSGAIIMWPGVAGSAPAYRAGTSSTAPAIPRYEVNLDAISQDIPGLNESINARLKLLYITCGMDDGLIRANQQLRGWLVDHNIKATYKEVPGYAHVWSFWRRSLIDLAPMLFR